MLALVAVVELLGRATGLPISLVDKGPGGTILMVVAMTTLLAIVTAGGRPLDGADDRSGGCFAPC